MQSAIDRFTDINGEDCNSFRFCNFVTGHEGGPRKNSSTDLIFLYKITNKFNLLLSCI